MAEYPALPLWTDAYLSDCSHLGDAEHGRYLQLLMAMWRAPYQRLPNDDDWLARHFRRLPDQVRSELRPLIEEFCNIEDGKWITQRRLQKEFIYLRRQSKKQASRAKARWDKEKGVCRGIAAAALPPHPHPHPHHSMKEKLDVNVSPKESPQEAQHARTGTRLPDDWQPSEGEREFAQGLRLDADRIAAEFADYWRAIPGQRGRKSDWPATWRNWCRRSQTSAGRPRPGPNGGSSVADIVADTAAYLERVRKGGG